jgi:hypothetical protein
MRLIQIEFSVYYFNLTGCHRLFPAITFENNAPSETPCPSAGGMAIRWKYMLSLVFNLAALLA